LKLNLYQQWFSPIMRYLIEGFVAQIRQTMERAIENDNEVDRLIFHVSIEKFLFCIVSTR